MRARLLRDQLDAAGTERPRPQRTVDPAERVLLGCLGPALVFAVAPACLPTGWMKISKAPVAWLDTMEPIASRSVVLARASTNNSQALTEESLTKARQFLNGSLHNKFCKLFC